MKVRWLNAERTHAIVTRGWLWWKRQTEVKQLTLEEWQATDRTSSWRWIHVDTGDAFDEASIVVAKKITEQQAEERRATRERNWKRVAEVPKARIARKATP